MAFGYENELRAEIERLRLTDAETLARMFHDEYERRAKELGYETRPDTRLFDPTSINGRLMVATCRAVMERISPQPTLTDADRKALEWAILTLANSSGARVGVAMDNTLAAQQLRKLLERCAIGHQEGRE